MIRSRQGLPGGLPKRTDDLGSRHDRIPGKMVPVDRVSGIEEKNSGHIHTASQSTPASGDRLDGIVGDLADAVDFG